MTDNLKYVTFNTEMGWVGILASADGLVGATLPQRSAREAYRRLGERASQAVSLPNLFQDLGERLKAYFSGNIVEFPDKLDLSGATGFQRRVWEITRNIPYGENRSYLWVAMQTGRRRAARAAGQALGRNLLPVIIPCHRVIASDGKLGGFSGGLELKRSLLDLEASAGGV